MTSNITSAYAYSMFVNPYLCLGSGFLAVPWVFLQAGFLPTSLVIVLFWFITLISGQQTIEAMSRAEVLWQKQQGENETWEKMQPMISDRVVNTADLYQLIINPTASNLYIAFNFYAKTLSISLYFSIWAVSLAREVPIFGHDTCDMYQDEEDCRWKYLVYLGIIYIISLTLTIIDFAEQRRLQVLQSIFQVVLFSLMILTAITSILTENPINSHRTITEVEDDWRQKFRTLSIIVCSYAYINSVCPISSRLQDKDQAQKVQLAVATTLGVGILVFGAAVGYALDGSDSPSQTNLAWTWYDAGLEPRPMWTRWVELAIVLLPALNFVTSGPLQAQFMIENIVNLFEKPTPILKL